MTSSHKHNADHLLNKIREGKGLEENKKLIYEFYHEKLASGSTIATVVNHLKILSRLVEFMDKPFKKIEKVK